MKTSLDLFDSTVLGLNSQLHEVHEGVLAGWYSLSKEVQNLVLWSGVKCDQTRGFYVVIQLEWEIAIGDELVSKLTPRHTFFLDTSQNIKARTKELFTKTVLQSLGEIAKGLQENTENLKDILK